MMYDVQQQQQAGMDLLRGKSPAAGGGASVRTRRRRGEGEEAEEEERLEIVDLSGMSLEALPNPTFNLGAICKLDLSNNNLQARKASLAILLYKPCSSFIRFLLDGSIIFPFPFSFPSLP